MQAKVLAGLGTLLILGAAPDAAARTRTGRVGPGRALKVKWRLAPYTCHLMRLSATKRAPRRSRARKRTRMERIAGQLTRSKEGGAPLRVAMADGKVARRLKSAGEPIVQRLCSGSNAIVVTLSMRSTVPARATARLTRARLRLPARDPGREAWLSAAALFQAPFPAGYGRTLFGPTARFLGTGQDTLSARLNLARGRCYRVQVRAAAAGELRLRVTDPDDKPRLSQTLRAQEERPLVSDTICPRATEAHRMVLRGKGPRRAVAWRLIDAPLGRGPAVEMMRATQGSPELAPCLRVSARKSGRLVCPGGLVGGVRSR